MGRVCAAFVLLVGLVGVVPVATAVPVGAAEPAVVPDTFGSADPLLAERVCAAGAVGGGATFGGSWPGQTQFEEFRFVRMFVPSGGALKFGSRGGADGDGVIQWAVTDIGPDGLPPGGNLEFRNHTLVGPRDPYGPFDTGRDWFSWQNSGASRDVFVWTRLSSEVFATQIDWENYDVRIEGGNGDTGPPCDPGGTAWDAESDPPAGFPHCVVHGAEGVLSGGRCFGDQGAASGFVVANGWGETLTVPTAEGSVSVASTSCSAEWISLDGKWLQRQAVSESTCPMVLVARGAVDSPVDPSHADVAVVTTGTGLPIDETPAPSLLDRFMFVDPGAPAGSFSSDALRFDPADRDHPVAVDENSWLPVTGEGTARYQLSSFAYDSGNRSVDVKSSDLRSVYLTAFASSDAGSSDPHRVEHDVLWSWEDEPGGVEGMIDPGEPFDVMTRPVLQPLRLIALGDSYSAGEGATHSEYHSCARSPYSYSGAISPIDLFDQQRNGRRMRQLVQNPDDPTRMYRSGNGAQWGYVACGGAVAENVWADDWPDPGPPPADPQDGIPAAQRVDPPDDVPQLANPVVGEVVAPNAVTLSIGGNDAGFSAVLYECVFDTLRKAQDFEFILGPSGSGPRSCEEAFAEIAEIGGEPFNPDGLSAPAFLEQVLRPRLAETYRQVTAAMPEVGSGKAVVTVFGYPTLLQSGCFEGTLIGADNVAWLAELVPLFNTVIREEAEAAGFAFVAPEEFAGHEVCSADPYIWGIAPIAGVDLNWLTLFEWWNVNIVNKSKSFHPNDAGWQAYADGWVRVNQGNGQRLANGMLAPPVAAQASQPSALPAVSSPLAGSNLALPGDRAVGSLTLDTVDQCAAETVAPESVAVAQVEAAVPGSQAILAVLSVGEPVLMASATIDIGPDGTGTGSVSLDQAAGLVGVVLVADGGDGGSSIATKYAEVVAGERSCARADAVTPPLSAGVTSIDVLGNDEQGSGSGWDATTLAILQQPTDGSVTVSGTTVVYEPDAGFRHRDGFVYEVCDLDGYCSAAPVEVDYTTGCSIVGVGAGPLEGTGGDDVICGAAGFERIDAGGGNDTVYPGGGGDRIDMGDGGGLVERHADTELVTATNAVTVTGPDGRFEPRIVPEGRPTVVDDSVTVSAATAVVHPLLNDHSPAGLDAGSFRITAAPRAIDVEAISVDGSSLRVVVSSQAPVAAAPVSYRVCDTLGRCDTALMWITTGEAAGSPPEAVDDQAMTNASSSVALDVLENDTDPEDDLDETTLELLTTPTLGTADIVDSGDGPEVAYTAGAVGGSDQFLYRVCDQTGLCDVATVTVVVVAESDCTILGTDGDDVLTGTPGDDVICGLDGDDTIDGAEGNDLLIGGKGADTIAGGDGNDDIHGNQGADILQGNAGADTIRGNRGADQITGGSGADLIRGGKGNDDLRGGDGNDTVYAGKGRDSVRGDDGDDELHARRGDDTLRGNPGADQLFGGRGADTLQGGKGPDQLYGRRGPDQLTGGNGPDLLDGGKGTDTGDGGNGTDACQHLETATNCET